MFEKIFSRQKPEFRVHFNDGPFIEYLKGRDLVISNFYCEEELVFSTQMEPKGWSQCFRKYFCPWRVEVLSNSGEKLYEHKFDPANKRIRINIDSKSLGDTLAWIPQVNEFARRWPDSEICCAYFLPELHFERMYTNIRFIEPDSVLENVYATYNVGYYFEDISHHHPKDPRTVPLGQIAADILGIEYGEIRPKVYIGDERRTIKVPYVCIATQSTAACKLWLYEGGWQRVIDYLNDQGYNVVLIQKEEGDFQRVINKSGDHSIQERIADLMHCEFFVGLGSGLSWLAWALDIPVVLISGFSQPFAEFESGCFRVINKEVCHGCWNSTRFVFDKGDWDWCPLHRSTPRQFECSREISPEMVIEKIDHLKMG